MCSLHFMNQYVHLLCQPCYQTYKHHILAIIASAVLLDSWSPLYLQGAGFYPLYLNSQNTSRSFTYIVFYKCWRSRYSIIVKQLQDIIIIIISWQVLQLVVQTQTTGSLYFLIQEKVIFHRKQSQCFFCVTIDFNPSTPQRLHTQLSTNTTPGHIHI